MTEFETRLTANLVRESHKLDVMFCSNRHNHVSAFPGYGRVLCLVCQRAYIHKEDKNEQR